MVHHERYLKRHQYQSEDRDGDGDLGKNLYYGFLGKEWARQGKQVKD